MLFSHISDIHLGLVQYNSEERELDIYDAFHQAIDISIKDHVDFVIFAGDIFHTPTPSGTAIMHMANALKLLKQNNIDSFFILGEHDISRIRGTPVPYVFHNLEFSKYIGQGEPVYYKGLLLVGFDKIRRNEVDSFEKRFEEIDNIAKKHQGHRILVMHQGINEINKFAGELNSTDLPKNFTYYAMGHLHDHVVKNFSHLSGPVAYPGSIELTNSEGIKETKKGFYQVDVSSTEAKPSWIELNTRPQFSIKTTSTDISKTIDEVFEKIKSNPKKPIVELKIESENVEQEVIQAQISRLIPYTLHCSWKLVQKQDSDSSVLLDRPARIDEELFKLAVNSLKSEKLASFAVKDLLPILSASQIEQANQLIIENFEHFKKEKQE
ncbi:MAG: DNA double-strand break repair protein mre11 [Nitrosopumilales archaeon]|nr:MAG: DNA double-strand break repair protein mre11 [Nitrosopumilales archaeon]